MGKKSLQYRIALGLALSLALVFSLQLWMISGSARRLVENKISSNMMHEIENLLSSVKEEPGGAGLKIPAESHVYYRIYSGHYYTIRGAGFEFRSRSLWEEELPDLPDGLRKIAGPRDQTLLARTETFTKYEKEIKITVAEDITDIEREIASFKARYAAVSVFTLILLLLVQIAIVRVALAPLARARVDADRMERGETEAINTDVPAELVPFITRINRLTAMTRKRLNRTRNALGDLAHALKTPLAALVHGAESGMVEKDSDIHRLINETIDKVKRHLDRELRKARLAGAYAPGKGLQPATDIPPLLKTLGIMYRDKEIKMEEPLPEEYIAACDAEDMIELLGTLMDNACKWADRKVLLSIVSGKEVRIAIEDDGPGCPPDMLKSIVSRGTRLDESVPGHGLGLAIAMDIIESYNGRIAFARSGKLGGLKVEVAIPL